MCNVVVNPIIQNFSPLIQVHCVINDAISVSLVYVIPSFVHCIKA